MLLLSAYRYCACSVVRTPMLEGLHNGFEFWSEPSEHSSWKHRRSLDAAGFDRSGGGGGEEEQEEEEESGASVWTTARCCSRGTDTHTLSLTGRTRPRKHTHTYTFTHTPTRAHNQTRSSSSTRLERGNWSQQTVSLNILFHLFNLAIFPVIVIFITRSGGSS